LYWFQLYDDLLSRSKKHIAESSAAKTEIEGASLAMVEEVLDDEEPRLAAAAGAKNKKMKTPVPPSPKKLSNNTFLNMCMELIKVATALSPHATTHTTHTTHDTTRHTRHTRH
jgi:hypothetical protein